MEMFQTLAGVKLQAVHYKGATPALTDVMAGHIQLMFISVGSAVPQWKADKVKFIAVGAGKRLALLPEMPTVAESGLPGYEAISWFGLFGPAGMPADVVSKINGEVAKLFSNASSARISSSGNISSRLPARRHNWQASSRRRSRSGARSSRTPRSSRLIERTWPRENPNPQKSCLPNSRSFVTLT